ncbi:unnamed protein product [Lactuca virosa]|uniref:Uncharacterized protein n=1 Tax=Lactuca virosa TaxID=75947 RepID=A0AAU9NYN8_9ASTR|nr:unnamed protein product [Lactuca virosa]
MEKPPPPPPSTTSMSPMATPVSNLYDSYEFRAISKQLNRAIKGSNNNSPLSPYSFYLKSATPFYSKQVKRICGTTKNKRVLCLKTQDSSQPRAKGFVSRLWAKVKGRFIQTH